MRIILLITSLGIFTAILCSSATKKQKTWCDGFRVPGIVFLDPKSGIDQSEVTNFHWREFQYWLGRTYGKESAQYKSSIPDTALWLKLGKDYMMSYDFYHSHQAFRDYPVVCISYEQAVNFCQWRSNMVFTYYLIRKGEIAWDDVVHRTGDSIITIEKYKAGTIPGITRNPKINVFPNYHLPSRAEINATLNYLEDLTFKKSKRNLKKLSTIDETDDKTPTHVINDRRRKNRDWIFHFETNVSEWVSNGKEVFGQNWLRYITDPTNYSGFETTSPHPGIGFRCAFTWDEYFSVSWFTMLIKDFHISVNKLADSYLMSYLLKKIRTMKLSSSLLQAITLGVSVTAIASVATSCEKEDIKKNTNTERAASDDSNQTYQDPCPACGMG